MSRRQHLRLVPKTRTEISATSMEPPGEPTPEETATTSMVAATERDDWSDNVCSRLAEIGRLPPGWDGYRANSIPDRTVNFALLLLGHVSAEANTMAFPAITPMSNGAIMIEWRTRTHEITVEVNDINDVCVLLEVLATGHTDEIHVTSDFSKISDALEQGAKPAVAVA